jgi:hypothetical protein
MMGMVFPIERWVAGAGAATLTRYLASAPSCRGDCVWLECLVQTIEAYGQTEWSDVRHPRSKASLRGIGAEDPGHAVAFRAVVHDHDAKAFAARRNP